MRGTNPGLATSATARLLVFAAERSPFYRRRFAGIDLRHCDLADLPTLTKAEMMDCFDDLVTDRRITRAGVEQFLADPANRGKPYLGRYAVCHTSGSQGQPSLIVQEQSDILMSFAVEMAHGKTQPLRPLVLLMRHCASRRGSPWSRSGPASIRAGLSSPI